jgi:hypothetical protein
LWADLLSSAALAFNLFGDLDADLALADRAVHDWFPNTPGRVSGLRFAHSPGWLNPAYLNSLRSFTTMFVLDLGDGNRGILAVDVKYHEINKRERPRPDNLARYAEVAERSGAFASGAIDTLKRRSDLCVMWLEHLLLLSMMQHPTDRWTWGRLVVVHPAENSDVVDLCSRYRAMLADDSTFATKTLEDLLDTRVLASSTVTALRDRYLD